MSFNPLIFRLYNICTLILHTTPPPHTKTCNLQTYHSSESAFLTTDQMIGQQYQVYLDTDHNNKLFMAN